jgi:excisionase family DNA binding protein
METIDMLKTGDVARLLGVSRQHVVDMCERGEIGHSRIGRHRRIPRSEVARLKGVLTREQERSLWLHRALLGHLLAEPEAVIERALKNIQRWRSSHRSDGMTVRYLEEWERVLQSGLDNVVDVITSPTPEACELRQNTPFAGALPDDTRQQVLRSFNRHWHREHEPAR